MPFKSKKQQRFMFAAEQRGELPGGTAERWARHTPNIKRLPERARTKTSQMLQVAHALGQQLALEHRGVKTAGLESLAGRIINKAAPVLAPAAIGAYVGGREHWREGALAGGLLGAATAGAIPELIAKTHGFGAGKTPYESLHWLQKYKGGAEALEKELARTRAPDVAERLLNNYKGYHSISGPATWAGRLGAGALGGYGIYKFYNPGRPWGTRNQRDYTATQGTSYSPAYNFGASPAVSDIGTHYTGLVP